MLSTHFYCAGILLLVPCGPQFGTTWKVSKNSRGVCQFWIFEHFSKNQHVGLSFSQILSKKKLFDSAQC